MAGAPLHYGPRDLNRLPEGEESKPYDLFEVRPLTTTIGAELHGIQLREADAEIIGEIHRALLEWKVLFFRDQRLTRAEHLAFATQWGPAIDFPMSIRPGRAGIHRMIKDGQTPAFENVWHSDCTWNDPPPFATVLRALEVPPAGGDTIWADMAVAYDNLPEVVKVCIDRLKAVHDWKRSWGTSMTDEAIAQPAAQYPPVTHPVVRLHPETGRKTLFVNEPFTERILGLDARRAKDLLDLLLRQARVPEYQVRFRWEPDSVAFWDNRAVQHYAVNDYFPQRRVMERVLIGG